MSGMACYAAAGRLIEAIDSLAFAGALADGLRDVVPYEFTVIFGYVGSATPLALFDDSPADRRRLHVEEYQAGPYLLDPFYLASRDPFAPGSGGCARSRPTASTRGNTTATTRHRPGSPRRWAI